MNLKEVDLHRLHTEGTATIGGHKLINVSSSHGQLVLDTSGTVVYSSPGELKKRNYLWADLAEWKKRWKRKTLCGGFDILDLTLAYRNKRGAVQFEYADEDWRKSSDWNIRENNGGKGLHK